MNKSLYKHILLAAFLLTALAAEAAPAYPGKIRKTMADGRLAEVYLRGDEYGHYYETIDGHLLDVMPDGRLCLAENEQSKRQQLADDWAEARSKSARVAPANITRRFPTTGVVKGLVILAEYQDVKFSTDTIHAVFDAMANQHGYDGPHASGSVYDYFVAQSGGLFTPEFEVVGPVQLPHNRRYYGENEKAAEMIVDACDLAKSAGVDFTQFDVNADGNVDFVFVVYAGYGESQGGPTESIWPKMLDMTYETWNTYDGLFLGVAACTCELHGNEGSVIDGVGTFCHEFSHILGLPDIYDTGTIPNGMGMMAWDVMDIGMYNDDTRKPACYTAMDLFTVGWLQAEVLDAPELNVALKPGDARFIVNPANPNEYYTLENRQQVGWDSGLPAHGLIVSHIHYVPSLWSSNRVNQTSGSNYEHVELVPADGNKEANTYAGDPFPGSRQLTTFSSASWHTDAADYRPAVTNIREEGTTLMLDFRAAEAAGLTETTLVPAADTKTYDLMGRPTVRQHGIVIQNHTKYINR